MLLKKNINKNMCFIKKFESTIKKAKEQNIAPSSPSVDENKYLLAVEISLEEGFDITKSSLYKRRAKKKWSKELK